MCGKEIAEQEVASVAIEYSHFIRCLGNPDEKWKVCYECAHKVRDFVIDGGEVCQQ